MLIVVPVAGGFYELIDLPSKAASWVRYDVPDDYRYYHHENNAGCWHIHEKYLLGAIELSYKQRGQVDYSRVPVDLQIQIATAKENWVYSPNKDSVKVTSCFPLTDAYAVLHLLPSAPDNVVAAVWRVLAKSHHPDSGGDPAVFRKYREAYDVVKKEGK